MEYVTKQQEQITAIATNVEKFINRETKSEQKINQLEKTLNNMQKFFSRQENGMVIKELLPEDNDFNPNIA